VLSPVRVEGFLAGVRVFQLRYGGSCRVSAKEMEMFLCDRLPRGSRWHAAYLGAGAVSVTGNSGCARCVKRGCYGCRVEECGCGAEVVWTDVLVDFGEVPFSVVVNFTSDKFLLHGCAPRVRACSGTTRDCLLEYWQCGWGGPFGKAYDREFSMLYAPIEFWRCGERLFTDVGNDFDWEVVCGRLRRVAAVSVWRGSDGDRGRRVV
jgi:hypothetical protein